MSGSRDFETEEEAAAAAATALQSITSHARIQATSIPSHNGKSSFVSVAKLHSSPMARNNKVSSGQYGMSSQLRDKNKKKASYSSRRQKHNESESRRRTRIRHKFSELRVVSRSDKKDRYTVLVSAIERLRYYEARLQDLEKGQVDYNSQSHPTLSSRIRAQTNLSPTPASPSSPGGETPRDSPTASIVENGHTPISVPRPINPSQKDPSLLHKIDECLPLKNVGLAMAYISLNGLFQDCNQAFCELVGFSKKQLMETSILALTHPNDVLVTSTMMRRLSSGEIPQFEMDKKCVRQDSSIITTHVTMASVKLGGKPLFHLCFMTTPPLTLLPPLASTSLLTPLSASELLLPLSTLSSSCSSSSTTSACSTTAPSVVVPSTLPLTSVMATPTALLLPSSTTSTTTLPSTASALQQLLFQQQISTLFAAQQTTSSNNMNNSSTNNNNSLTSSSTTQTLNLSPGVIAAGLGLASLGVGGGLSTGGTGAGGGGGVEVETLVGHSSTTSSSSFVRPNTPLTTTTTTTSTTTTIGQPSSPLTAFTSSIPTSSLAFSLSQPLQSLPLTAFPQLDPTSKDRILLPFDSRLLAPLILDTSKSTDGGGSLELQLKQLQQFQQQLQQPQQAQEQESNQEDTENTPTVKKQRTQKKVPKRKRIVTTPTSGGKTQNTKRTKKLQPNGKREAGGSGSSFTPEQSGVEGGVQLKVEKTTA